MYSPENLAEDKLILSEAPQLSEGDVSTYFKGGHWGQCFELLQHLCQYSESVILVTGAHGLGKSTLKQALIEDTQTQEILKCCSLDAKTDYDAQEIMTDIAKGFGLLIPRQNTEAFLPLMDDKTWVLLIDDAHLLSDDVLRSLIQLSLPKKYNADAEHLHLILFGMTDLEKRFMGPYLRDIAAEQFHVLELEALTFLETEAYLLHKWRLAGNNSPLPFDPIIIQRIYHISGGNPREVERLAHIRLAGGKLKKQRNPNFYWKLSPIILTAIIALAGVGLFYLYK